MKQTILFPLLLLFAIFLVLPAQRTASASGQLQRGTSTPTPTPAAEGDASGGVGNAVESNEFAFDWLETDYLTALLPATWQNQETELDEAEGTFTFMVAADEITNIQEQGALIIVQSVDQAVDPAQVLDSFELPSPTCGGGERSETSHSFAGRTYTSVFDSWRNCPDEDSALFVLITLSEDIDAALFAVFFAPTDIAAVSFDVFRNTVNVVEVPPMDAPVRPSTPPVPAQTPTPTPVATEEPAQEPTGEPTGDDVAVVVADRLNVRSGPATSFDRIAAAERGEILTILGRNADCTWINVRTPADVQGWVAAGAQYITFNAACNSLTLVAAPPTPTPLPATPTPPATNTPVAAAPTATATSQSAAADDSGLDPALGCFLFENQIGVEVTITFTRRSDSWNVTFRVPRGESSVRCFDPGDYTYTLDAPPPWDSTNGDLRVVAGERIRFPIQER